LELREKERRMLRQQRCRKPPVASARAHEAQFADRLRLAAAKICTSIVVPLRRPWTTPNTVMLSTHPCTFANDVVSVAAIPST
jgi:hypothetical protein